MKITEQEILRRRDMREVPTFTIDPADAKDFDDAISFQVLDDDTFQVGVHIADVTHFVECGSDIDRQAYERGTSVYLVDRVVPMLPETLCNDLCSLRPGEDKLCMSVIFTLARDARVLKHKVCRTIIRSDFRLTYEQAQTIIDGAESPLSEAIKTLHSLATVLRRQRMKQGALEIEQEEIRFRLDEKGHPVEIFFHQPSEANHLIEEFMLLANRTIATQMSKTGKEMVYRVHDKPDDEKLVALHRFQKKMGERIPQQTIDMLTVRAMAKAEYSTHNIGHYGLAFDYYTHFTSPIRRYPDMIVHRLVAKYLLGERTKTPSLVEDLQEQCEYLSEMEQQATQAERDSIKDFQILWLNDHLGEEYDGVITNVMDFGLFVRIEPSHCEGLVPIRTICPDSYLVFDESAYSLRTKPSGRRRRKGWTGEEDTEKCFTIGDHVRVRLVRADLDRRQVDFEIVEQQPGE